MVVVLVHHAGFAFAKAEGAAFATTLHLSHHVQKEEHDDQNGTIVDQNGQQQRGFFARLDVKLDLRLDQVANQALVHAGSRGAHGLVIYRGGGNFSAASRPFLNRGFFDLAIIDLRDEFGIVQRGDIFCLARFKVFEDRDQDHQHHEPHGNFRKPLFVQVEALRSASIRHMGYG